MFNLFHSTLLVKTNRFVAIGLFAPSVRNLLRSLAFITYILKVTLNFIKCLKMFALFKLYKIRSLRKNQGGLPMAFCVSA